MGYSLGRALCMWAAVWAVMVAASFKWWALGVVAMGVMALHIADWLLKAVLNALPRHTMTDVANKGVFITGCDTGFGHSLALRLDQLGFKVFAGCLVHDGEGARRLMVEASNRLVVIRVDVTKDEDVTAAYQRVQLGLCPGEELWAVVNNAGVASFTEIEWCSTEVYKRTLDVNALGPVRVTKTFLPLLRHSRGRVVIVASLAGRYTFPGFSAYSMSKHAAVSFADGLRLEMQKWGITVHTVEPTLYKTPIAHPESIHLALEKSWQSTPKGIRESYGDDYKKDFMNTMTKHLEGGKPVDKISEVVDDLVDAICGLDPKMRYVPSMITQVRSKLLSNLPTEVLDSLMLAQQPKTPPAELTRKKKRSLVDPRGPGGGVASGGVTGMLMGPGGKHLKRGFSMPNWDKSEISPSPIAVNNNETKFKFPINETIQEAP